MVNPLTIPQIYTILAYGLSICLWVLIPQIVLLEGVPFYLMHPYFTAELFLMLSTLIMWIIFLVISLSYSPKQDASITKTISQDLFTAIFVLTTIIASISGCIFFLTKVVYYAELPIHGDSLVMSASSSPDPLAAINVFGILFSEVGWIVLGISRILKERNWSGPEAI